MSGASDDDVRRSVFDDVVKAGSTRRQGEGFGLDRAAQLAYLAAYYRHVPLADLTAVHPLDLYGAATAHWQLAQERTPGQVTVRATSPTVEEYGWASPHTVVQIVTDDMPYLVDSISAELTRQGRGIHLIIHPVVQAVRDESGSLLRVAAPSEPADGARPESWMHVEIDRESDVADLEHIEATLREVLFDVRRAVDDFAEMAAHARRLADRLKVASDGVSAEAGRDATELLNWMASDNFVFVGYHEYILAGELSAEPVAGSGLGILRGDAPGDTAPARDTALARDTLCRLPQSIRQSNFHDLLVLAKANFRSPVHRNSYLDYVGVKTHDESGRVTGESVFLGLFSATAYTDRVHNLPVVRRKVDEVMSRAGFAPDSHSSRDLLYILETFPRDELLQASVDHIFSVAMGVLHLQERRQVRIFARVDEYGRFVSVLVYLPRDRFNTQVRVRIQQILAEAYGASSVDFSVSWTESVLARLHLVARMPGGVNVPEVDIADVEHRVAAATRSWSDDFAEALVGQLGEEDAAGMLRRHPDPFPEAYKEDFDPRTAVTDLCRMTRVDSSSGLLMSLYSPPAAGEGERRFKIFRSLPMSLSEVLPIFQHMGVEVLDERPYVLRGDQGRHAYLYDFGLRYIPSGDQVLPDAKERFQDAFAAVWSGAAESDGYNALVLRADMTWQQAALLRAYGKYLRQTGTTFSPDYVEEALVTHHSIARLLVELFESMFDPAFDPAAHGDRAGRIDVLTAEIVRKLNAVASLDQDRILRSFLHLIRATLRTNFYQGDPDGGQKGYVSFKLDPQALPDLPEPRPRYEIWVYSPRVEGVHLRFGPVARGGLRWSDRREDFRTEVLGLVKAQMVKNAVIVPTGAKGGFVVKRPPADGDREAQLAEGIACYQIFIRGMLDITDNLVVAGGAPEVQPPPAVVRHDGDDPYLVVAADKGTATFSDFANAVALEYGFWLGDAFASGGSAGYDHKEMGITARGAWESVRRHFQELGHDTQAEDFTVVGVGDMSGDVFGNGMLLSEHIRLVAAFDHRHIFLDPEPDAKTSFAERRRLYDLPRSSWADYNPDLISAGGGVYARTDKSIPVSEHVRSRLGIAHGVEALSPSQLIRAILTAPVDLLFNGGIGTYVKATLETDAAVGDKTNDPLRVNGADLRCRVVGEGGNLGFTQLGRIEYALAGAQGAGGRINTDAIDNSAGVDTSDHEVNLKVLLNRLVDEGELTEKHRNGLLSQMQEEVARLVLRDNYEQNLLLAVGRVQAPAMVSVHRRLLNALEADGGLDRSLEFLPSDAVLEERASAGTGLTSPELSVLLAYAKISLKQALLQSTLPEEPWYDRTLRGYFPDELVARYGDRLPEHRLRREIIATCVVNDVVNRAGTTFVFRATEESGAAAPEVVRAFTIIREVFDFGRYWAAIEELDGKVPTEVQMRLYLDGRRLLDRGVRWLLHTRSTALDVAAEIDRFGADLAVLAPQVPDMLTGDEAARLRRRAANYEQAGAPADLAERAAALLDTFSLLDIVEIARSTNRSADEVARVYFRLSERFGADALLDRITELPRGNRWHNLARSALRYDLYSALAALTADVVATTPPGESAERIAEWETHNAEGVSRAEATLSEVLGGDTLDLAVLSVALRSIRTLLRVA